MAARRSDIVVPGRVRAWEADWLERQAGVLNFAPMATVRGAAFERAAVRPFPVKERR